jgi:predicted nucleotidyltransferase
MEEIRPLMYTCLMVQEILDRKSEIATLCRELGVTRLYVFGSATYGACLGEVGDLDFLVQFEPMLPVRYAHNYFRLAAELQELFQTPVDLVEIETLENPYFKEAVEESKVQVYELA